LWWAERLQFNDRDPELLRVSVGSAGHHIALVRHAPENPRFREPVVLCHGLAANRFNVDFVDDGHGSDRLSLARFLSRSGFDVWVLELRGRGLAQVPSGADWTVDDEVSEDLPAAISAVIEETGSDRLFWVGHSKGGILQFLLHAREHPEAARIAGLVALGSPGTFRHQQPLVRRFIRPGRLLVRWFSRVPMRTLGILGLPLAGLIHVAGRRFLPAIAANDGPRLRRVMVNLPADIARGVAEQFFSWIESHDGEYLGTREGESAARIRVPLFLIAGSHDLLAPPGAVEVLRERVGSEDVSFEVMGKEQGCMVDYGHGDLVIGQHAPDEVFPRVRDWIANRAATEMGDGH
jgi:pimeloyl-ACP methyl ester carboxylesterase